MPRVRLSTTVDVDLLARARAVHAGRTDASVVEAALLALLREHRAAEIDQSYDRAYRHLPMDARDGWGDLGAFVDAVART
jgi:hypothetical protein